MKFFIRAAIYLSFVLFMRPLYSQGGAQFLPVLVYHHIEEKINSSVSCTPLQFEAQMRALIDNGYKTLNLCETASFLSGSYNNPNRPVLITFDDGYESVYKYAFKTALKLKINMVVFVITSRIGRKPQFSRYLTESEIKEMSKSGCVEFGSHTHDLHTAILRIFNAFGSPNNNPFIKLLDADLKMSSARLKGLTGSAPVSIAWPYGGFNNAAQAAARANGFKLHFTSIFGYNQEGSNPFSIKRIPISSKDTPQTVLKKANAACPRF